MNGLILADMKPRTFALVDTPNVSDPAGKCPLLEYDASVVRRLPEGIVQTYWGWTGWRSRLIAYLIRKLLRRPDHIYQDCGPRACS